jgi:hypothetical protein
MNRSTILIIGLLILSFLGMLVGFYFFYPQINEEKFAEITSAVPEEDSTSTSMVGTPFLRTYDDITNQIDYLLNEQMTLQMTVDSLNNLKEELTARLSEMQDELNNTDLQDGSTASDVASQAGMNGMDNQAETQAQQPQQQQPQNLYATMETVQLEEEGEAFADRVKSLLNLDEEELAPILSKLNNDQLTRLYRSAGNIQREKLLRSLNPDRAARLMESIML